MSVPIQIKNDSSSHANWKYIVLRVIVFFQPNKISSVWEAKIEERKYTVV